MGKTYSTVQVARKLKYSPVTICEYCKTGLLPGAYKNSKGQWEIPEETYNKLSEAKDKHVCVKTAFDNSEEFEHVPKNSYTLKETSIKSGFATQTLQRYCQFGLMPGAVQVGQRWYIPEETVNKCKEIRINHGKLDELAKQTIKNNINIDELDDYIDINTASIITNKSVSELRFLIRYNYLFGKDGLISKSSLIRCGLIKSSKEQQEPEAPIETPELEPEPEPPTPQEPEPSVVSSATIQGHEIRLENVDVFDLFTQAYDALKLICDTLGGCADKDMTAVYTDFDDIRKSLVLHRPDIEAINDYTYTLVYLDGNPNPAVFPVRKQSGEGAVA